MTEWCASLNIGISFASLPKGDKLTGLHTKLLKRVPFMDILRADVQHLFITVLMDDHAEWRKLGSQPIHIVISITFLGRKLKSPIHTGYHGQVGSG
ncbi:hypothetical protein UY286_22800 [Paenibacillus polymyxa]|uniref:hypothetical protein n=1 Tax=Paenibacillus polymyxa TaxID=1406 RepID=UPI002AB573E4|nr:hypothetical protein [Paenibacillus polymyxa]MDY7993496.1 hypothetical protein [Paenibacillus polymyxa]MDY8120252.1 hypothetical protein [Paenibacillus polymyxa]